MYFLGNALVLLSCLVIVKASVHTPQVERHDIRPPKTPTIVCIRHPCVLPVEAASADSHQNSPTIYRPKRSAFDDKGFTGFTPDTNTRGSIYSSKSFGPNSHGGWESSAKVEHDFWKSNNGNHKISGFLQHDRIDGGRFGGFKDTRGGVGYQGRFRRSAAENDKNTRGSIQSSKSFGPNSHGGWESSAKVEHDFWKSNNGNHKISGFVQHDRIDGGRFGGFKDTRGGVGYQGRFRRSAAENDKNTRGSIQSSKSFGPNSHGGWESSAKVEHDFWKSNNGNHKISGFVQHDRIDGGRFGGFKDTRGGVGYQGRFRRSAAENDKNTRGSIQSSKSFGPNSHGGWESSAKVEHDFWKSNNGNHKISGFVQHDRIDGGRFDGFKDTRGGVGYQGRFRRSAAENDKNTRGSIQSSKSFGPNSHGGWESSAKVEHDFWKSNNGNHKISGFVQHDRIDGGRFGGFKDTRGGVGYQGRFRRSAAENDKNTRGSIQSSKSFGPNSHGGWESSAKVEHDFWKSNNGNHKISGFVQHDRIDGGRFGGFKDTRGGVGYQGRFRRSAAANDKNTRGSIQSSKSFGPNSHGGWESSAKVEHDFWKSNNGNHKISGFVQHDRIDGGRFGGFKDTRGGVGYQGRFRRSAAENDKNTRGSIQSSKSFGPNSHGGWESSAKVEHDFWKSNNGNHKISGFVQHDRIDGGRFGGFKDTRGGVGYQGRFRRSAAENDKNTRGSIQSSKSFGPNSHGGWESSAKVEHDFWKSNNGNHKISGFVQHDRIDGGRFGGFKDTRGGVGYQGRFRRSAAENDKNTRGSIQSSKSFGPNSHGGWESSAKVEHDFWKSNNGNHKISGFVKHDRIDGGRFDGFKDTRGGVGYQGRFRRSAAEYDKNTRGSIQSSKSFGPNSHGGWESSAKVEHDIWKSKDGNSRVSGFLRHDRIDGGKFDGFKDNKFGVGYEKKF